MPRVRKKVASRARRKKYLKLAKGYRSGRRRLYRSAREAVERALCFAYRDRKVRKREFRSLWITRINGALAAPRDVLQQIHGRLEEGRYRPGSQNPGGPRGLLPPGVRPDY
jgi:ribosomal protein L20